MASVKDLDTREGRIALEEHFALDWATALMDPPIHEPDILARIFDTGALRVEAMNRSGVDVSVLSLTSPGIQGEPDAVRAVERAQQANDQLAVVVSSQPDRFAGFGAMPLQDPTRATEELGRCVRDLEFCGVLVNGYSNRGDVTTGVYYDGPEFDPFWASVQELDIPVYLHPRLALAGVGDAFDGYPEIRGAAWGFAVETATHAIRLIQGGVFDRFPRLKLILGHLGEMLPLAAWRLNHRLQHRPGRRVLERSPIECIRENFYFTTSGNLSDNLLRATIAEFGAERILFASDYPYESLEDASHWLDVVDIADDDRAKISHTNAKSLLRL